MGITRAGGRQQSSGPPANPREVLVKLLGTYGENQKCQYMRCSAGCRYIAGVSG